MLTVRGLFNGERVILIDDVPYEDRCDVLVTFLREEDDVVLVSRDEYESLRQEVSREEISLTGREYDVLQQLRRGLTNKEIAIELQLSAGTIRNYTSRIYQKLDVRNRTEAVTRAGDLGFFDEDYHG